MTINELFDQPSRLPYSFRQPDIVRDQKDRPGESNEQSLQCLYRADIEVIGRLVEHEEVGFRNQLLRKHQLSKLTGAQVVAIEQSIGVGVQACHDGQDTPLLLLRMLAQLLKGTLSHGRRNNLRNKGNLYILGDGIDDGTHQ